MAQSKKQTAGGKKPKQKDELQTFIGQQAAEKFTEALSKSGAVLETPLYPFRAGYIQFINLTGKDVGKYGAYHFDESDKDIFKKTVGSKFNLHELRAFLAEKCNVQNPENYSWPDIIAALKLSLQQGKPSDLASGGKTGKAGDKKKLKPLSEKAVAVLELLKTLPEHRGMTGPKILETLDAKSIHIDQSNLTKNIIPELRHYGVKNKPRIGYYIER